MRKRLFIDVETYSSADIKSTGAYKYIASPDFEILMIGWALENEPVTVIDLASGEPIPDELDAALTDSDIIKVAHNAVFERLCFARIGYDIPVEQWFCTLVKSAYCGLPLSLDQVSKVLDLENKKKDTGKLLINYFSKPCKPTITNGGRTRNMPWDNPDKWALYKDYNEYDVEAEREIYFRLEQYEWPESERLLYQLDQKINDNGILVDVDMAKAAIDIDTSYTEQITQAVRDLTGVENPNSDAQIKDWIKRQSGLIITSFAKANMAKEQERFSRDPLISEVLRYRGLLSRTSVKKYYAMVNAAMNDNRVRGTFQFYGANRTGRWAGRLLQLQNLSKNHIADIDTARTLVKARDIDALELMYEDVPDILSQLVRTALVAPDGCVFAVADFSAIEARVISWLAGEDWRMNVFRGDGKIYEATGARMFNVPITSITKGSELRQKAKIAELALGYEGGVNALKKMGGEAMGLTDQEMRDTVTKWRNANPSIVELWAELNDAALESYRYCTPIEAANGRLLFECDRDREYLTLLLPSGRKLYYKEPHITSSNSFDRRRKPSSLAYNGLIQATKTWGEILAYGGKFTENVVQAIARDLLSYSMMQLNAAGFKIVCHIHDECLTEVPAATCRTELKRMEQIMGTPPNWASDLPLRADGYVTSYYKKD